MDQYWNWFYIIVGVMAVVGVFSKIFTNRIKQALDNLNYYADGKVTSHHSYVPYD
ncbi:MAG: hypothetical protein MJA84_12335 [Firmicutes bacterium]|nr:hypothetical protein [Bacillota bacterium]